MRLDDGTYECAILVALTIATKIAQAQGRVIVQADCTPDEALLLMQQRAESAHLTLAEIAVGVNNHRIWFNQ